MYTKQCNYNSRLTRKSLGKHCFNIDLFTNSPKMFSVIINTFYDNAFSVYSSGYIHLHLSLKILFGSVNTISVNISF